MKKWLLTLLFASALVLSACGGGASDDSNDGAADSGDGATTETASGAEDVYKNNCASCHGGDLSGGMGPELTTVGADYSADEIADIIDNGLGSMPAVNMTADDRDAVSEWLASKK